MNRFDVDEPTVTAYLAALLWSTDLHEALTHTDERVPATSGDTFDEGTALDRIIDESDVEALNPEVVSGARDALRGFQRDCLEFLGFCPFTMFDPVQVANDFALSRNGHGAGFFDDPYEIESSGPTRGSRSTTRRNVSAALQARAREAGEVNLILSVDESGKLTLTE